MTDGIVIGLTLWMFDCFLDIISGLGILLGLIWSPFGFLIAELSSVISFLFYPIIYLLGIGIPEGFKMNFSALWIFWASLSNLKIQMRKWIFDRFSQWITRFLYDSLLWSMKLQLKHGQILTKRNFRDYLGWWAPQANFLWTFMVENTWFFGKYTKFSHKLSRKIDKTFTKYVNFLGIVQSIFETNQKVHLE